MLENIRIILVNPSHPGNIGAAARAMKVMGLSKLYLVEPKEFPSLQAEAMASSAVDVLNNAMICSTLFEAIADCQYVFGLSAIPRALNYPIITPREAAKQISLLPKAKIAFVFGRESSGLTTEEIQQCHQQIKIPANPAYSSLNLAAAVQVICYELRMVWSDNQAECVAKDDELLANVAEREGMLAHFTEIMQIIGFHDPQNPRHLKPMLRRIFNAANLTKKDIDLLRGFLSAIQKYKHTPASDR